MYYILRALLSFQDSKVRLSTGFRAELLQNVGEDLSSDCAKIFVDCNA